MNYVEQLKAEFENLIKGSSWWSRFIGSQFVSYLTLFVAQIVSRVKTTSERALQESFLSLATNRTSILAAAEDLGHVGLKISPSKGMVRITNKGTERVTLPIYAQCIASNQLRYTIMESVDLAGGETKEYPVQQFELATMSHLVNQSKSWLSIVFPFDLTQRIHKVFVKVNGELWENSYKFRFSNSTSKKYMEYYKSTDQLGIRFGNDICAMMPKEGDLIEFETWLTEGDTTLIEGQKLELIDSGNISGSSIPLEIVTTTAIIGGADGDDIEEIRNAALYTTAYDNQVAWDGDYKQFIKNNIGDIVWLSVWGEAEQEKLKEVIELRNINRIFITAYSTVKTEETISSEIVELFKGREGYNEKYEYVPRRDHPFTITVNGFVVPNSSPVDAETAIKDRLSYTYGKDASKNGAVYAKDIWRTIEDIAKDLGIEQYQVECTDLLDVTDTPIDTYQYLDMENSTISLKHRPVS